jgi:membrane protease YdiL (CAAX protease family)
MRRRQLGLQRVQRTGAPSLDVARSPLVALTAIGALEELVYRGVLLSACLLVPVAALRDAALAATVAAFALSHVWYGWPHVLAKLPLGVLALASALAFGTVLAAVAAHVVFNAAVWRDLRGRASTEVQTKRSHPWSGAASTT